MNLDIIWSGIATIGAFLMVTGDVKGRVKIGMWLLFIGFVIQSGFACYNLWQWWGVSAEILLIVVALLIGFRRVIFSRKTNPH